MMWRWFVCEYPSGPRLFRLATDGSTVERASETGWVSVPGAMERLLTDPDYVEIEEPPGVELRARSHHGGGAKSGNKTGGGGRAQYFGMGGKFAKSGAGTFSDVAAVAKKKLDEILVTDMAEMAKAAVERPPASDSPELAADKGELAALLHEPMKHRMEFFAEHVPNGPEARAIAATKSRQPVEKNDDLTPAERYLAGLYNGEEWALDNLADSKLQTLGQTGVQFAVDDGHTADLITQGLIELRSNERYQKAVAQFGPVPIIPVRRLSSSTVLAQYGTDVVAVSSESNWNTPIQTGPLEDDAFNVDTSINGTIRHEYGHHIQSLLTSEQRAAWERAYDHWGYGDLGQMGVIGIGLPRMPEGPNEAPRPPETDLDKGMSIYARTNDHEAFAETFNFVTRPDYGQRKRVPARVRPMVNFMNDLIDGKLANLKMADLAGPVFEGEDLRVHEERKKTTAKTGLKEGAGGHLQHFGEHGKYAKIGQDLKDTALLIDPVSGSTPRKSVSADLTMAALPEAVRAKALAQLQTSLGVDPETAIEHLVTMAESAHRHGLPGRLWYSEARTAALASAERYGVHSEVGIAVVAAMSPGTKWEENLRNAEAVMSMHQQWDQPIDEAHIRNVNVWAAREDKTTKAPNSQFRAKAGDTLGQLYKRDPHLAAVYAAKKTNASAGYSYDNFFKGIDLVAANDPKVIDRTLNGAKVRSFFNNISAPTSEKGHVTIDVHMQRAMANDLDSTTPQQKHERLNSIKNRSTAITGSPSYNGASLGAMPVMADITREATRRFNARHKANLRPSEFQAVVWTEQINQFPPQTVEAILKAPVS